MLSLRDFTTGKEVSCVPSPGRCWSAVFFPDGRCIAVDCDQPVKLWDIAAGREVRRFEDTFSPSIKMGSGFPIPLAISPNGTLLAAAGADNSILLWEVATGRELSPLRGHHDVVQSLAFFPDGKRLLSGSSDTTALVWDLSTIEGKHDP
jgi:WD40 repeat protein